VLEARNVGQLAETLMIKVWPLQLARAVVALDADEVLDVGAIRISAAELSVVRDGAPPAARAVVVSPSQPVQEHALRWRDIERVEVGGQALRLVPTGQAPISVDVRTVWDFGLAPELILRQFERTRPS
jgi:hypothetical protein